MHFDLFVPTGEKVGGRSRGRVPLMEAVQTLIPLLFGKPCMVHYPSSLARESNPTVVVSGVALF